METGTDSSRPVAATISFHPALRPATQGGGAAPGTEAIVEGAFARKAVDAVTLWVLAGKPRKR